MAEADIHTRSYHSSKNLTLAPSLSGSSQNHEGATSPPPCLPQKSAYTLADTPRKLTITIVPDSVMSPLWSRVHA
jgi:hypothetical protein